MSDDLWLKAMWTNSKVVDLNFLHEYFRLGSRFDSGRSKDKLVDRLLCDPPWHSQMWDLYGMHMPTGMMNRHRECH